MFILALELVRSVYPYKSQTLVVLAAFLKLIREPSELLLASSTNNWPAPALLLPERCSRFFGAIVPRPVLPFFKIVMAFEETFWFPLPTIKSGSVATQL